MVRTFITGGLLGAGLAVGAMQIKQSPPAQRFPQFENEAAKCWRTVIAPGSRTEMHRHDHPRVVVALTPGAVTFVDESGAKDEHVWEAGKAYWLPAMPTGAMHADVNAGEKPIEVMVVELEKEK